jgi:hypothetical protein
MKIRNGFVSNSSSSSFLAIAKKVDINDISSKDLMIKKYYTLGKQLSDGVDLIHLQSEDMLKFFQIVKGFKGWTNDLEPFTFYEIVKENPGYFSKKDLDDDGYYTILSDEFDYHSCETLDDLLDCYCEDNKEKISQRINRPKKLGRILNEK